MELCGQALKYIGVKTFTPSFLIVVPGSVNDKIYCLCLQANEKDLGESAVSHIQNFGTATASGGVRIGIYQHVGVSPPGGELISKFRDK